MFKTKLNVQNGVNGLFTKLPSLQFFAAGENNDLPVRSYQKEFKELLPTVYDFTSYFKRFFVNGEIEALDGVTNNRTAFTVKTSDIPVVVGTYNVSPQIAFGNGTSASNRFGNRREIIYIDTDVEYTWGWAFHEGLDRHTVNNNLEDAILDRLELQARAKSEEFDAQHGKFISDVAENIFYMSSISAYPVERIFNEMSKYYRNIRAVGNKVAMVVPDLYNAIVDSQLATTSKHSSANIDRNEILMYKGFQIIEMPDDLAQPNEVAYMFIEYCAKAFTGINTTRTIASEDFDGVALQGAGKAGQFIPEDNKKAVSKIVIGQAPTPPAP